MVEGVRVVPEGPSGLIAVDGPEGVDVGGVTPAVQSRGGRA